LKTYARHFLNSSVLLFSALAYKILQTSIVSHQGLGSKLKGAVGRDIKWKLSMGLYLMSVPLALLNQWVAVGLFVIVPLLWLVPDRRIEEVI